MREKIAGYFRISMEDDDRKEESNSVTNQRMLVRRYILEHKDLASYEYVEFYDDGVSGATMRRPGMQQLLEKLKQNEIGCIVVKDLSRFSRDFSVFWHPFYLRNRPLRQQGLRGENGGDRHWI